MMIIIWHNGYSVHSTFSAIWTYIYDCWINKIYSYVYYIQLSLNSIFQGFLRKYSLLLPPSNCFIVIAKRYIQAILGTHYYSYLYSTSITCYQPGWYFLYYWREGVNEKSTYLETCPRCSIFYLTVITIVKLNFFTINSK